MFIKKSDLKKTFNNHLFSKFGRQALIRNSAQNIGQYSKIIKQRKFVGGIVPFKSSSTEIIIYNFFGPNYGLRSPFLLLASVFDEKFEQVGSTSRLINNRETLRLTSNDFNTDVSQGVICHVELLSDRLKADHASHEGHLRFFAVFDDASVVHSLPLPTSFQLLKASYLKRFPPNIEAERRHFPPIATKIQHLSIGECSIVKDNHFFNGFKYGYNLVSDKNGKICSVWHDAPKRQMNTRIKNSSQVQSQSIAFPFPQHNLDAYLWFEEFCTSGSEVAFSMRTASGGDYSKKKTLKINTKKPFRLSDLFDLEGVTDKFFVVADLVSGEGFLNGYIDIHYTQAGTKKLFDQVHANQHGNKWRGRKSSRALKFSTYNEMQGFSTIVAIWGGGRRT